MSSRTKNEYRYTLPDHSLVVGDFGLTTHKNVVDAAVAQARGVPQFGKEVCFTTSGRHLTCVDAVGIFGVARDIMQGYPLSRHVALPVRSLDSEFVASDSGTNLVLDTGERAVSRVPKVSIVDQEISSGSSELQTDEIRLLGILLEDNGANISLGSIETTCNSANINPIRSSEIIQRFIQSQIDQILADVQAGKLVTMDSIQHEIDSLRSRGFGAGADVLEHHLIDINYGSFRRRDIERVRLLLQDIFMSECNKPKKQRIVPVTSDVFLRGNTRRAIDSLQQLPANYHDVAENQQWSVLERLQNWIRDPHDRVWSFFDGVSESDLKTLAHCAFLESLGCHLRPSTQPVRLYSHSHYPVDPSEHLPNPKYMTELGNGDNENVITTLADIKSNDVTFNFKFYECEDARKHRIGLYLYRGSTRHGVRIFFDKDMHAYLTTYEQHTSGDFCGINYDPTIAYYPTNMSNRYLDSRIMTRLMNATR